MPLSSRPPTGWAALAIAALLAAALPARPARAEWTWRADEDDSLSLAITGRLRGEAWESLTEHASGYYGLRVRPRVTWRHGESLAVVAEGQLTTLGGLTSRSSGPSANYYRSSARRHYPTSADLRLLHVDWKPAPALLLRAGRHELTLGDEIPYAEADWAYLKKLRIGQRLLGTVPWSHVERSYDGGLVSWSPGFGNLSAFAATPTTGVFDVDDAYRFQSDVAVAGVSATAKRGALLPHTELSFFALGYEDDRRVREGGLRDEASIVTLGGHAVAILPLGPGALDLLAWAAGQLGRFDGLDHDAWAFLIEAGYRLPDAAWKPWLRAGLNAASGDADPGDGEHETFHNLLPTNHLYYGYADLLAFQNLVNPFVQLRLAPHPRLSLDVFLHGFWLQRREDSRYGGTGFFNESGFGYTRAQSRRHRFVGWEIDLVAGWKLDDHWSLEGGLSYLSGAAEHFAGPEDDVEFVYLQAAFRY